MRASCTSLLTFRTSIVMGGRVDRGVWKYGEHTEKLPQRQGPYASTVNGWFFISVGDISFSPRRTGVRAGCVDHYVRKFIASRTTLVEVKRTLSACVRRVTTICMKAHPIFLASALPHLSRKQDIVMQRLRVNIFPTKGCRRSLE